MCWQKGKANMKYCIKQRWSFNTGDAVSIYHRLSYQVITLIRPQWISFFHLTWAVQSSLHSVHQKPNTEYEQYSLLPQEDTLIFSFSTRFCIGDARRGFLLAVNATWWYSAPGGPLMICFRKRCWCSLCIPHGKKDKMKLSNLDDFIIWKFWLHQTNVNIVKK